MAGSTMPEGVTQMECDALRTIAVPLPTLQRAVRCSANRMRHVDVGWVNDLLTGKLDSTEVRIRCNMTLLNFDESRGLQPGGVSDRGQPRTLINSPRSTLVLLRNGCAPEDLLKKPLSFFRSQGQLEGVSVEVQDLRARRYEDERSRLTSTVRAQYAAMIAHTPLEEIIDRLLASADAPRSTGGSKPSSPRSPVSIKSSSLQSDGTIMKRGMSFNTRVMHERAAKGEARMLRLEELRKRHAEQLLQQRMLADERALVFDAGLNARREERKKMMNERATLRQESQKKRLEKRDERMAEISAALEQRRKLMEEGDVVRQQLIEESRTQQRKKFELRREEGLHKRQAVNENAEREVQKRRDIYDQKQENLDKKKQAREWHEKEVLAGEKMKRREADEVRRRDAKKRAQERLESQKDKVETKRRVADVRLREYHREREEKQRAREEETRLKEHRRADIKSDAQRLEEEMRQQREEKAQRQAEAHEKLQKERTRQIELQQEEHRLRQQEKMALVDRQRQVMRFEQLKRLADMQANSERIDRDLRKQQELIQRTRENRREIGLKQEKMQAELFQQEVTAAKDAYFTLQAASNPRPIFKRVKGCSYGDSPARSVQRGEKATENQ
eukprot:Hpha_TRINITY_DN9363_c0_g1::TRINITY_DN9363_c0_g1_i1::g.26083::m.26083